MVNITVVENQELPPGIAGCTDGHTIWLSPNLTPAGRRCTLAHELMHCERGLPPPWHAAREEVRIDREVAKRLAPTDRLIDAVVWTADGRHLAELACELDIDRSTLHTRLANLTPQEKQLIEDILSEIGQVP